MKLDSEVLMCVCACVFFMLLYRFFVLHQPHGMRRFSGGSWKRRRGDSLFSDSPACRSAEIFKGVNPVMKLLERPASWSATSRLWDGERTGGTSET